MKLSSGMHATTDNAMRYSAGRDEGRDTRTTRRGARLLAQILASAAEIRLLANMSETFAVEKDNR